MGNPMKNHKDGLLSTVKENALDDVYEKVTLNESGALGERKIDFKRVRITGATQPNEAFHQNMSDVVVDKAIFQESNLSRCDIKDCLIRESDFRFCAFDGGALATNYFTETRFTGCTFADTSVINCEFHGCEFISCDLRSLFMKGCRLSNCRLIDCHTDNKAIESTLFFNTELRDCSFQIQMIVENFGLSESLSTGCSIRSARVRDKHVLLTLEEIAEEINNPNNNVLERLRLYYFVHGTLLEGGENLDQALAFKHWVGVARIPASFNRLIQDFSDFLIHLYEQDQLNAHVILLLHTTLDQLRMRSESNTSFRSLTQTIIGVHVTLSRLVEEYLVCLMVLQRVFGKDFSLVANGPNEVEYFENRLSHFLTGTPAKVTRVVPHNSPVDVVISWMDGNTAMIILALFLATRTKFEIRKFAQDLGANTSGTLMEQAGDERGSSMPGMSLFSVSLGFSPDNPAEYGLKLRSLMPGALLVDFRLQVSTVLVSKFRKILVDILKTDRKGD